MAIFGSAKENQTLCQVVQQSTKEKIRDLLMVEHLRIVDYIWLKYHETVTLNKPCQHCGKGFEIGQKVFSKQSTRRGTKYWHKECGDDAQH